MKLNRQAPLWLCAAAGAALALLWGGGAGLEGLAGPGRRLGEGLRALSLAGAGGNLAAWALVLAVSALPLLALAALCLRRGRLWVEDALLALMSPLLFALLYFLVNPTLLRGGAVELFPEIRDFFSLALGCAVLSAGVAWLVLRVLRRLEDCPADRLPRALCPLLLGGALLMAFAAGMAAGVSFRGGEGLDLLPGLVGVIGAAPTLLGAFVLLWGEALARAMGDGLFTGETARLCARTALGCRLAVQASVHIPLFTLILAGVLYLLCRVLERGKELQEDSDSII